MIALIVLLAAATPAGPSVDASKAFDDYVAGVEERVRREDGAGGQAVAAGDTGGGVDGVAEVAQALDVAAQGARGDLETAS